MVIITLQNYSIQRQIANTKCPFRKKSVMMHTQKATYKVPGHNYICYATTSITVPYLRILPGCVDLYHL